MQGRQSCKRLHLRKKHFIKENERNEKDNKSDILKLCKCEFDVHLSNLKCERRLKKKQMCANDRKLNQEISSHFLSSKFSFTMCKTAVELLSIVRVTWSISSKVSKRGIPTTEQCDTLSKSSRIAAFRQLSFPIRETA